ncbi:MAG TPA: hypothetical protein VNH11_01805 [Pirellulales bacterium]|nr:hypothetical protein [Pirellulales bacterium]
MNDPYEGRPGEEIDPQTINVYRGGHDLDAKPNEYKVDRASGYLKNTHGVSVETDQAALARFGEVRRIKSIPPMLTIVQRGQRLTHFEIVPRQSLTPSEYQAALDQVELE